MPKYQPVTRAELRTSTSPRPGVRALHDVVCWWIGPKGLRSGGIYSRRAVRGGTSWSLHAVGRAADFMCSVDVGKDLSARLIAAKDLLGITEVIHNRMRWTEDKGCVPYKGSNPHTDHVHVAFTIDFANRPDTPEMRRWCTLAVFPELNGHV